MAADRFPVEATHVLMFARAVGYPHAAPDDPAATQAVPATFAIASAQFDPDYPLRPSPTGDWFGSGGSPGAVPAGGGALHAEQHFVYHRPIRIGDVLSATIRDGEPWEKSGRSGRLLFTERFTDFRDESGELVVTMHSVGVRQEAG